jgi:tetratricopeptide (TPR) repeat protein
MIRRAFRQRAQRCAAAVLAILACVAILSAVAAVENDLPPQLAQLHNAGRYQELAQALQSAVQNQPQAAVLHYWLGRSYYELRDYDRAEASLERATQLSPDRSEFHDWLGKASGRKAERANPFSAISLARKAYHAFQTAVRLAPTNIEAQRDLIRYLLNAPGFLGGGDDEALKQIQALSTVDSVDGMLARAEYFVTRKKFDQASEEYQKLQKSGTQRIGVALEIAEFYRDRGDAAHMQSAVDAAARIDSADVRLDYYRGVALVLARQDAVAAETRLHAYLQKVPDGSQVPPHSSAHQWLGKLYEAQGRREQAAAEYQSALSLDPRNDDVRKALLRVQK